MSTYIPAWSDIFILYLWGSEANKDLLLSFINTVLEDADFEIVNSVDIQNPFNPKSFSLDKKSILDIKARDKKGRIYDIEVQSTGDRSFINRSLYYWAKLYSSQLTEGDIYTELRPTICINILNFSIFAETQRVHNCFLLFEQHNKELALTDHLQLHFIELPKLNKSENLTKLESWLYFLLYEGKEDSLMKFLIHNDQDIAKAHDVYTRFTQDDKMRDAYEAREKWLKDYNSAIAEATEKGIEQGLEKGIEKGLEKGIEKGIEKGKMDLISKMIEIGLPYDQISKLSGLSEDEIKKLGDK